MVALDPQTCFLQDQSLLVSPWSWLPVLALHLDPSTSQLLGSLNMSAAAVPVWRRRGDIMFLQRRIMMLENDLNGAIASAGEGLDDATRVLPR